MAPVSSDSSTKRNSSSGAVLCVEALVKSYGATQAVAHVSVKFDSTAITAVVGGNGAGKSTLMKAIAGEVIADGGELRLDTNIINDSVYNPEKAHKLGIRIVHQELSLANSLTVAENFYIEHGTRRNVGFGWRKKSSEVAKDSLRECFGPGIKISSSIKVGLLTAGERQMVEIARAVSAPNLRVLILDEPTSALSPDRVEALGKMLRILQERGIIIILITHKMDELPKLTDRVVVMRGGKVVEDTKTSKTTSTSLLASMLGGVEIAREKYLRNENIQTRERVLQIPQHVVEEEGIEKIEVFSGEVVGLLGLQDAGQEEFLRAIQDRKSAKGSKQENSAYITGDRKYDGIFPLWDSTKNLTISWLLSQGSWKLFKPESIARLAKDWFDKLGLPAEASSKKIGQLSGGMQQKVLFARGLSTESKLLLLNDPTRGVDLHTKLEMYDQVRTAADEGRGILWYSSEDSEFTLFDRTYVIRDGVVVGEFINAETTLHTITTSMFSANSKINETANTDGFVWAFKRWSKRFINSPWVFALIGLVTVLLLINSRQQVLNSFFSLGLILSLAPVLALAALSMNFVLAVGDIDLSIGAFMALIGVISATSLNTRPVLGVLLLVAVTLLYPILGWIVKWRKLPSVIATLAMSFVYSGLALTILPNVGGQAPNWLIRFTALRTPIVPLPIWSLITVAAVGQYLIEKTRLGTRIRAIGSNEQAFTASGWNATSVRVMAYGLAGFFAALAGLMFSGIATAGDANSTQSYTLIAIAAVVVGGSEFIGGRVTAVGGVLGAILLSLVGVFLGVFAIPSLYTSAAIGGLLIVVMGLRKLTQQKERA